MSATKRMFGLDEPIEIDNEMSDEEMDIIEQEIREERNRESHETHFDSWFSDNKDMLMDNFVEEYHQDEFMDYCREEYKTYKD